MKTWLWRASVNTATGTNTAHDNATAPAGSWSMMRAVPSEASRERLRRRAKAGAWTSTMPTPPAATPTAAPKAPWPLSAHTQPTIPAL